MSQLRGRANFQAKNGADLHNLVNATEEGKESKGEIQLFYSCKIYITELATEMDLSTMISYNGSSVQIGMLYLHKMAFFALTALTGTIWE